MADNHKLRADNSDSEFLKGLQPVSVSDRADEEQPINTSDTTDDANNTHNSIDAMKEETKLVIVVTVFGLLLLLLTVILLLNADVGNTAIIEAATTAVSETIVS